MTYNFKKIAAACTAAVLALALAACGNSDNSDKDSKAASQSSQTEQTVPQVTLQPSSEAESAADDPSESEPASEGEYAPAMWLVTSPKGGKMYMMGSMHYLRDECYPLPDYVQKAYDEADTLAVECDITDRTASFAATLDKADQMYYSDGTTLRDHLGDEIYDNLEGYMAAHDEKLSLYDQYQLWYLDQVVSGMAVEDAQLKSSKGLDMNLLQWAHDDGKEIYEVESITFQMDLLANFSEDIYKIMLSSYSADSQEELTQSYEDLYQAWRTGDTDAILALSDGETEQLDKDQQAAMDDYNDQMLYSRNKGMAAKAEELIDGEKRTFFVVGAAHFVGDGGIIDLLTKDGYTCERVTEAE